MLFQQQAIEAHLRLVHLFGYAEFITAVGTGLSFKLSVVPLPVPFATFTLEQNPLVGLGLSGAVHFIVPSQLKRRYL
jgi:hypothetical protein